MYRRLGMTVTNHVYSPWIVTTSKKWWDSLSKEEQKVLIDVRPGQPRCRAQGRDRLYHVNPYRHRAQLL